MKSARYTRLGRPGSFASRHEDECIALPSSLGAVLAHPHLSGFVYSVEFNDVTKDHGWASRQTQSVLKFLVNFADLLNSIKLGQFEGVVRRL